MTSLSHPHRSSGQSQRKKTSELIKREVTCDNVDIGILRYHHYDDYYCCDTWGLRMIALNTQYRYSVAGFKDDNVYPNLYWIIQHTIISPLYYDLVEKKELSSSIILSVDPSTIQKKQYRSTGIFSSKINYCDWELFWLSQTQFGPSAKRKTITWQLTSNYS